MNRETGNVLLGFLVGAVAGGVAALLFAPSAGQETRQKIAEGLGKAKNRVYDEYGNVKDYAKCQADAIKEGVNQGKDAYRRAAGKDETV